MVRWTKNHPFGTFLINVAISLLAVGLASIIFIHRYGEKIDTVYKNSIIIKESIVKIKRNG